MGDFDRNDKTGPHYIRTCIGSALEEIKKLVQDERDIQDAHSAIYRAFKSVDKWARRVEEIECERP